MAGEVVCLSYPFNNGFYETSGPRGGVERRSTRLAFLTYTGQVQTSAAKPRTTPRDRQTDPQRPKHTSKVTFADQISECRSNKYNISKMDPRPGSTHGLPRLAPDRPDVDRPVSGVSGASGNQALLDRINLHTGTLDSSRASSRQCLRSVHWNRIKSSISLSGSSRPQQGALLHRRSKSAPRLWSYIRRVQDKVQDPAELAAYKEKRRREVLSRFRRAVRMVVTFVKWFRVIRERSATLTPRTAVEMQWHTLNTSSDAKKLAFNPAKFARNRVHTSVPPWARKILCQTPDMRSEADCRKLHAMVRGLRSLDRFTEKIQLAMCRACSYHYVEAGRIILRRGHVGINFYFLYSGSVFVNVEDVNAQGETFVKTEVVLTKGDSFGELALLNDTRRVATIACREDCELFVVDKEVFAHACPQIFDKELEEKISFVSQMALFHPKYWGREALHNICFEAQIQEYKTGKVVVDDSAEDGWVHICMQGRCRIVKCLPLNRSPPAEKDRDERPLLAEEDMLTAEFLASQKTSGRRVSDGSRRRTQSEGQAMFKKKLLRSMCLAYTLLDKNDAKTSNPVKDLEKQKSLMENDSKATLAEEQRMRTRQGTLTLHTLVELHAQQDARHREFIYLDIGTLNPQEAFNLAQVLQPRSSVNGSCLVLVSSGVKILRMKKDHLMKWMSEEALEHAKHIAMCNMYPTDEVLLRSYRNLASWDDYKHQVVKEVMTSFPDQTRRRPMLRYIDVKHQSAKSHESRLLSTLKHNKNKEIPSIEIESETLSLDSTTFPDLHESFESRMFKEVDDNGGSAALGQTRMIPQSKNRSLFKIKEVGSKYLPKESDIQTRLDPG